MKKILTMIIVLGGCSSAVFAQGPGAIGLIYNQTSTGLSTNNQVTSDKEGKTCTYSILSLVAFGDASVASAKADGGISKVSTVDNSAFNVLGLYGRYCTIVKGS